MVKMRQRSKSFTANTSHHAEEDYENNHDGSASEAEETVHSDDFHIPEPKLTEELIEKLLSVLPAKDNDAYYKRLKKINWEMVTVDGLSIEQSQSLLERSIKPVMKIRTLAEVLVAAKELHSDILKHPDRPKRPISAYQIFSFDKRPSLKEKHPEWNQQQLVSRIAAIWSGLSEKKKAKYHAQAEENRRLYEKQIRAFEEEHPDLVMKAKLPKSLNADTAFSLYYQDKTKECERRLTLDEIRQEWKELPFSQKLVYIRQQVEKMGSGLNNKELKAYRKEAGLPEKPRSSYMFFLRDFVSKHPELNFRDVNKEASEEWKRLSQDKHEKWERKYTKALEKYKARKNEFQQSASDELKTLLQLKEDKGNTPKPPKPIGIKGILKKYNAPTKPTSAYFIFMNDFKEKHPNLGFQERGKATGEAWKNLSDEQRARYEKKYQRAMERYKAEWAEFEANAPPEVLAEVRKISSQRKRKTSASSENVENLKPMTKQKPLSTKEILEKYKAPTKPTSAYFLFMQDFKEKHPNLGFQERGKATGEAWKNLSDEQRARYEKKYQRAMERYKAEWAEFEANAPPEVLAEVREKIKRKKRRTTSTSTEDDQQPAKRRRKESTSSATDFAVASSSTSAGKQKKHSIKVEEPEIEPPKKPPNDIVEFYAEKYHEGNEKVAKKKWKKLPEEKKKKIMDKYKRVTKKFIEQLKAYLKTLNPEQLAAYHRSFAKKEDSDSSEDEESSDDSDSSSN